MYKCVGKERFRQRRNPAEMPDPHCIALIITQFSPIVCIKFLKIFYFREENQVCTGSNRGFPLESSCFFVMYMVK